MAPDDLKFMRMEARIHEQQLIMAELGGGGGGDNAKSRHAEAIAEIKHQRADPMMAPITGTAALGAAGYRSNSRSGSSSSSSSGTSGLGGSDSDDHGSIGGSPVKPLMVAASRLQKYGACEPTINASEDQVQLKNAPRMSKSDHDDEARVDHECRSTGATIGGNKFVAVVTAAAAAAAAAPKKEGDGSGEFDSGCDNADSFGANQPEKRRDKSGSLDCEKGFEDDEENDEASEQLEAPTMVERLAKVIPCLGILLALCSSVFLGTAGMLVKLVESVHGIEVAVFRAVIQLAIYGSIICLRGTSWRPRKGEVWPVAGRAILGGTSITCSYYALKLIPLGDATTIRFSLPIWTLVMSYFFLHESCNLYKVVAVAVSIAGVVLVTKPDDCVFVLTWFVNAIFSPGGGGDAFEALPLLNSSKEPPANEDAALLELEEISMLVETGVAPPPPLWAPANSTAVAAAAAAAAAQLNHGPTQEPLIALVGAAPGAHRAYSDPLRQLEGCLMALASSVCLAMSIIALRMCKQTPSEVCIFWLSLSSVLVGLSTLACLGEWALPNNLHDCLFILLNGLCGSLGQWFMTSALKVEQSGLISLARTFDIEVAFLYSALLLGEQIRMTSIIGSILVSLGVITVLVPRWIGGGGGGSSKSPSSSSPVVSGQNGNATSANGGNQHDRDRPANSHARDGGGSLSSRSSDQSSCCQQDQQQQQQTVTTLLNGLSLDARRSLADARSIEALRKTLAAAAATTTTRGPERTDCARSPPLV